MMAIIGFIRGKCESLTDHPKREMARLYIL
jgi:hypothetical protein